MSNSGDEKAPLVEGHGRPLEDSAGSAKGDQNGADERIKTYWWRWVVLALFVVNAGINYAIWMTFAPIANVVKCYYGVSDFWVNSLSMVYMVTYILFILPSMWFLNTLGLRPTLITAACCNAIGACLRMAAVGPQFFWLLLTGQTIASLDSLLMWGAPSYMSSIWFPPSQRGIATAVGGSMAPQLGVMIGYLSPLLVHSDDSNTVCGGNGTSDQYQEWSQTIYSQLFHWLAAQAAASLLFVIVSLVAFPSAPPTPPSKSRQLFEGSMSVQVPSLLKTLLSLAKNGYFLLFLITAGINISAINAVLSLLNEMIHPFFPNRDHDVAFIGLTAQLCSIVSAVVTGIVLDITKAFYAMSVLVYWAAVLAIGGLLAVIEFQTNFYILYPMAALVGTSTAFVAIIYEFAAEMTYPVPEGTSGGLLNWVSQPISLLTIVVGPLFINISGHHVPIGAWVIVFLVLLGAILTVFIRPELRKTAIDRKKTSHVVVIN